ncbi:putative tail tube A [Pelagibacter phage Hroenn EXVC015P]|nr:putative tail tube A [Pelagibacter phage Bylgja EXVC010P]QLF88302.1 putative tail tube A [Pelagibacter phage Himinglaeva EXVC011P]QLF88353.1 putative tail tube A [Pelagibacter phage Hroenn EXVC015P]QLF88600.1 putative tail tube A [Pelagibacter phage Unn EXVC019P]
MATQINATTELQAINTMLSFIGESPVSSITGNIGTDVAVAKNILDETSMSVQSQGWFFNRELNVSTTRDTSNKVPLEANCVQVEASAPYQYFYQYTIRKQYLYDLKNKTDVFTYNPVVDKVLVQQFAHLPEYARRYIVVKASRRFAARYVGATELIKLAQLDEQEAHMAFEQADSRAMDANIINDDYDTNYIARRGPRRSGRS